MIWGLGLVMILICLGVAAGLSLVIRSWAHGMVITSCFTAVAIVGLLLVDGQTGLVLAFGGGAGVLGGASAIGAARFWPEGSPLARAGGTVSTLGLLTLGLGSVAWLSIPT